MPRLSYGLTRFLSPVLFASDFLAFAKRNDKDIFFADFIFPIGKRRAVVPVRVRGSVVGVAVGETSRETATHIAAEVDAA